MRKSGRVIGEFLLIVTGVLVALAVETALEERADDNLRDEYISRIKADVAADKRSMDFRIEFFKEVSNFSRDTLVWAQSDLPVDKDVLLASFYAAEVWPFIPNLSTYQDLQSTGNIRLLEDIELRTSLLTYHRQASASRSGWEPLEHYREIIRGTIPTYVQEQIRSNCPTTDFLDQRPSGFPPCELRDVDYHELTALFDSLRHDENFLQILTYRHSELSVVVRLLSQQAIMAGDIILKIENR